MNHFLLLSFSIELSSISSIFCCYLLQILVVFLFWFFVDPLDSIPTCVFLISLFLMKTPITRLFFWATSLFVSLLSFCTSDSTIGRILKDSGLSYAFFFLFSFFSLLSFFLLGFRLCCWPSILWISLVQVLQVCTQGEDRLKSSSKSLFLNTYFYFRVICNISFSCSTYVYDVFDF